MEALTISAANLSTIEKNMMQVADELSGVISNVSSVNNQVNKVEDQVATLNNEVKNLVKEIRETTIITNARQNIMYNNEIIDKKFSYFDNVRRATESVLDAINNSAISRNFLYNMNQKLLLNNPNYWLSNALSALNYWVLNDRNNSQREVKNALTKDASKTSLFFMIINLKMKRRQASYNWLKKYLSLLNPLELDKDFITVLDMTASGILDDDSKELVLNKINDWMNILQNDKEVEDRQYNIWEEFISDNRDTDIYMPYLESSVKEVNLLKNNIITTSSYYNVLNKLNNVINKEHSIKNVDDILNNLIYDYEDKEQIYQLDNLKNNLIISCNGDMEEATRLYKKQESLYYDKTDLITILSNIVIFDTTYKISSDTRKMALSLVKKYIIKAYDKVNATVNEGIININVDGFMTDVNGVIDRNKINKEIDMYVENEYYSDDKDLMVILVILNVLGIIGIFITLDNRLLSMILIIGIVLGDVFLLFKMRKRNNARNVAKNKLKASVIGSLDRILAEVTDYYNLLKGDRIEYDKLIAFLDSLNERDYLKGNDERNIMVG